MDEIERSEKRRRINDKYDREIKLLNTQREKELHSLEQRMMAEAEAKERINSAAKNALN